MRITGMQETLRGDKSVKVRSNADFRKQTLLLPICGRLNFTLHIARTNDKHMIVPINATDPAIREFSVAYF
jgi:hypothetical protein